MHAFVSCFSHMLGLLGIVGWCCSQAYSGCAAQKHKHHKARKRRQASTSSSSSEERREKVCILVRITLKTHSESIAMLKG